MPLYIKDDIVDRLARRYQMLIQAPSKTEAVRKALQLALDTELAKPVLEDIAVAFCRDLKARVDVRSAAEDGTR